MVTSNKYNLKSFESIGVYDVAVIDRTAYLILRLSRLPVSEGEAAVQQFIVTSGLECILRYASHRQAVVLTERQIACAPGIRQLMEKAGFELEVVPNGTIPEL